MRRVAVAVALLAAAAFAPSALAPSVLAFERSTVTDDPTTPLYWRYRWVHVRAAADSCADVPEGSVALAVDRAVATWNLAAEGCSDFRLFHDGPPSGLTTNLDRGAHDGENRIVWREDEWPDEPEVLALTTVVYRVSTGQILDADIDLNGVHHYWTDTSEPGSAATDVENTLTHELGHLIGLAHAVDPEATMYSESAPGDLEKRSLSADDIAGICHVYPDGLITPESPFPRGMPLQGTCSAAPGGGSSAWLVGLSLVLLLRRRAGGRPLT